MMREREKRRKLLYPTLPEEWGHNVGQTVDRLEVEETQRMAFLKDGGEDMKIGVSPTMEFIYTRFFQIMLERCNQFAKGFKLNRAFQNQYLYMQYLC